MRLGKILVASLLVFSSIFASEFINYDAFSKKLKEEAKQSGMMASTQEVKDALNAKDWAEHLQQELMDAVLYLEKLKTEMKNSL